MGGACTRQARGEQPEQPEQQPAEVPKADPEELAKLSLSDLKEAFDALVCKDGQSYAPGKIMKVMYTSSDHCNYSTSGFDADESMTWKVFLPVAGYGRDVGYLMDVGYFWEKYERGARDAEELSAHVKLFPSGPSFKADDKKTGKLDRSALLVIMEEMPLLDASSKTQLESIIDECTRRH